jgi:hypothetical protein
VSNTQLRWAMPGSLAAFATNVGKLADNGQLLVAVKRWEDVLGAGPGADVEDGSGRAA